MSSSHPEIQNQLTPHSCLKYLPNKFYLEECPPNNTQVPLKPKILHKIIKKKQHVSMCIRENKALFQTEVNFYKRKKTFRWAYWSSPAQTLEKSSIRILWWGKSSNVSISNNLDNFFLLFSPICYSSYLAS